MNWKHRSGSDWGRLGMKCELGNICNYRKEKIEVEKLCLNTYISTENMLPNKSGIIAASNLPNTFSTQKFQTGDILVSNIRPYFKKIWMANKCGGCSNDVLVFTAKNNIDPTFLYYVLSDDDFFSYATATSKGTKMPRGDRNAIMQYLVPNYNLSIQKKIGALLRSLDDKIELNNKVNENLEQQAQILFKAWFIDYVPFNYVEPSNWLLYPLGEITEMGAGGDKPEKTSDNKSDEYPYPIYSNGINNDGLYGYTNKAKIFSESVTVSARGTIGFVCLRHLPYVPIVRLITLIPNENFLNAKYLYLYLKQLHISGTGTTQQQLTVPDFSKIEILIPDEHSMRKFTKIISPMFKNIWLNKEENISLTAIRDSLLPKLMSGEIDVSNIRL